jgi:hypothetical protein
MSTSFETSDPVIFTGDVGGVRINQGSPVMPPCPPPDIQIEHWLASISILQERPARHLFLTHYGQINDKKEHLDQLSNRLLDWANWMLPYFQAQTPMEEIVPKFELYVAQQLEAAHVNDTDIERYSKANPAFMSVAGLLRYWKKQTQV